MQSITHTPNSTLKIFADLREDIAEFQRHQAEQAAKWKKVLNEISSLSRIDWEESRSHTNKCIDILLRRGWFISNWHTPLTAVVHTANLVVEGAVESCDNRMAEHFSSLVPTIEKEIGQKFPTRYAILKEAFEAHVQGKYNLSIPVILAQADGIGIDTFGVSPYSRRKDSTDSLRRWIEVNLHAWEKDSPYLWVIADLLPINCSLKAT
jgi:hypothetical protein